MSVAEQLAAERGIVLVAVVTAVVCVVAIWLLTRRARPRNLTRALADKVTRGAPGGNDVEPPNALSQAFADGVERRHSEHVSDGHGLYATCRADGQWWPCRTERRQRAMSGPMPAAGEIDTTDYVALFQEHQECFGAPCFVHSRSAPHCRCGNALPCPVVALHINPDAPIPGQRNRNPEGRWP